VSYTVIAEICGNGIDDDGDGYVDCADLDCLLEGAQETTRIKSNTACSELSDIHIDLLNQHFQEFSEYGFNSTEAILALQMIEDGINGLDIVFEDLCNSGNDIFDLNGNFLRTDNSNEHGVRIEIDDEIFKYFSDQVRMSAQAHGKIGRHFLDYYLSESYPLVSEVNILGISNNAGGIMGVGSLNADIEANADSPKCIDNVGIQVAVAGLPEATISSFFFDNKLYYISVLEHELNHLFAEFSHHTGRVCKTTDVEADLNHIVIVWLQFDHSNTSMCFDNFGIDELFFDELVVKPIRVYLQRLTKESNLGVTNPGLIQWVYCNYLIDFLPEDELDFLRAVYDLYEC
jgi:hypothetical protein